MKKNYEIRINKILDYINKLNYETLIVFKNSDIYYLTGFYSTENIAALIINKNFKYFITDGRFINQFEKEVNGFNLVTTNNDKNIFKSISTILNKKNINKVLFPYDQISYKNYIDLKINDNKDSSLLINEFRKVKDNEEIKNIKKACKISEDSFKSLLNYIKEDITELEIRDILENEMSDRGSKNIAFPTIVASGKENGALPHAIPTNRKIKNGDLITIDFGATWNNYCSDITRTIALGNISDKQQNLYNTVLKTKKECEKFLKVGNKICDVNKKATDLIEKSGNKFLHSIGHGIGIDIHEGPTLNSNNDEKFKENQVHTIEPGIYIPGIGGVRIEDDYLINKDSYQCLTPNITCELITII